MKKLILFIFIGLLSINLFSQKIENLPNTTTYESTDLLIIDQSDATKNIKTGDFLKNVVIEDSLNVTGESIFDDTVRIIKPMYIFGNLFNGTGIGSAAAGNTGEVQFNTSNIFDAEADFFWNKASNYLGLATNTPLSTIHINNGVGALSNGIIIGSNTTGIYPPANDELSIDIGGITGIKLTADSTVVNGILKSDAFISPYDNTIYVAKSGGDYTSIKIALDAIIDNSSTNRYMIWVAPGIYTEDNPITGKSYVTVRSMGDNNSVRVVAQNGSNDLFIGANLFYLEGMSLFGVTGLNNYAVNMSVIGEMLIDACVFTDCSNGVLINHQYSFMNILNSALYTIDADMSRGVNVNAGNATIDFLKVIQRSDIDTLIRSCGENSVLTLNNIISFSDSVDVGFYFCNKSRISGYGSRMVGLNDGIIIEGDSVQSRLDVVQIFNATNDGFRIESTGLNSELALFATTISGCARWNFNVLNSTATIVGNGFTELDKGYIEPGARFYAYLLDIKAGDEGLNIIGELHVGTPEVPSESVFGGGDSYTRNMLVYEYNGASYTNVTDSALSIDGLSVNFPNNNVNTAIYIASTVLDSSIHWGIKAYMDDSLTIGTGEVIAEYYNGSIWIEFNSMVTDGDEPFLPHAKSYFEQNGFTQIRYDASMTNNDWQANDLPGVGNDHKWVRFRITSTITISPKIDQIKLHTSRTEINSDGFQEMFGNARNYGNLAITIGAAKPFEGAMQNQTIYVDEDLGVGYTLNRFTATGDKLGFSGFIPFNFDTSTKLRFTWSGRYVTGGTAQWTVRYRWISPDSTLYTSEPAATGLVQTVIVNATVTAGINEIFLAELDLSDAIPRRENGFGDQLWISLQPTTLPGSFDITTIGSSYLKWCNGGHW